MRMVVHPNVIKVLSRLRTTRALFNTSDEEFNAIMPGPRQPSVYEKDLANGSGGLRSSWSAEPLEKPSPHVLDGGSTGLAIRPLSEVVQGLLGGSRLA